MAARRAKEQNERREPQQKASSPSNSTGSSAGKNVRKKRKPRGALFHGNDPTLSKRVEEELYNFGR